VQHCPEMSRWGKNASGFPRSTKFIAIAQFTFALWDDPTPHPPSAWLINERSFIS
jgi:hypothetical protein